MQEIYPSNKDYVKIINETNIENLSDIEKLKLFFEVLKASDDYELPTIRL